MHTYLIIKVIASFLRSICLFQRCTCCIFYRYWTQLLRCGTACTCPTSDRSYNLAVCPLTQSTGSPATTPRTIRSYRVVRDNPLGAQNKQSKTQSSATQHHVRYYLGPACVCDQLASEGTNFINTYVASPQCVPSRTTMFTGRHTHQIKCWSNEQGIAGIPSV